MFDYSRAVDSQTSLRTPSRESNRRGPAKQTKIELSTVHRAIAAKSFMMLEPIVRELGRRSPVQYAKLVQRQPMLLNTHLCQCINDLAHEHCCPRVRRFK